MDSYDANQDKQINLEDNHQNIDRNNIQDIEKNIEKLQINIKSTDNSISYQITEFDEIKWLTGC